MSYCREEGKDKIIFITKKDYDNTPSSLKLPEYEGEPGLILANGDINWNCPCLGGMATGPCGFEFRQAFSCVKSSSAEPRGVDCFDQFKAMQDCFIKYPKLYGSMDDDLKEDLLEQNGDENVKTN